MFYYARNNDLRLKNDPRKSDPDNACRKSRTKRKDYSLSLKNAVNDCNRCSLGTGHTAWI